MYYHLRPSCALVAGAKRGAIYDFNSGKVYSLNSGGLALLTACQDQPLTAILDVSSSDNGKFVDFLERLTNLGLGSLHFKPAPPETTPLSEVPSPQLESMWLEITSCCNNRCLHCYSSSAPTVAIDCVPHERWLELISEGRRAGATGIQLIGGEPLLYPRWRELVIHARQEGYEFIEIFTNATLVTDNDVEFFREQQVSIATTIYADNAAVHDQVTLNPGSFACTFAAIEKILAAKIPLRIASIIMKPNEHEAENIMNLCSKLGVEVNPPDVVRPTGRGDDQDLLPTSYAKEPIKPPFVTDIDSFNKAHWQHCCLAGKLAVTSTGDVIPCIFARQQVCGNILHNSLQSILTEQPLQQCWHTTKDQVTKCQDCEYRYACADCRPLAQGCDPRKQWLAPSTGCSYNPYTGIWEDDK